MVGCAFDALPSPEAEKIRQRQLWPTPAPALNEAALFAAPPPSRVRHPEAEWTDVHRELPRRRGVTAASAVAGIPSGATGTASSASVTGRGGDGSTSSCGRSTGRARRRSSNTRARSSGGDRNPVRWVPTSTPSGASQHRPNLSPPRPVQRPPRTGPPRSRCSDQCPHGGDLSQAPQVAAHFWICGRRGYATVREHMPPAHRAHAEWTHSRLIAGCRRTGRGRVRRTALGEAGRTPEL